MESGEGNVDESCLETDLPTDVSLSQDDYSEMEDVLKSSENFGNNKVKNSGIFTPTRFSRKFESGDDARLFKEHKMKNELLKMSVQVKEKSIKMDTLKAEHFQKIENMESRLSEAMRQNGLLKTQMRMERDETKEVKEEMVQKLNYIECNQGHLKIASTEIQRVLQAPCLTREQYQTLLATHPHNLSLTEFISKHLYERQESSDKVVEELRSNLHLKQDQVHQLKLNIDQLKDDFERERQLRVEGDVKLQRSAKALELLQKKVVTDDFKTNNFDSLNKEKDELEMKYGDMSKQKSHLDNQFASSSKHLSECRDELTSLKQTTSLLTRDKAYLSQLNQQLNTKVSYLEGRCHYLDVQNDKYKGAREELYEKYIQTRDAYKRDYDERLGEELERMGRVMQEDIQRLKQANMEVSEREIRALREARDLALEDKRMTGLGEKEALKKYQDLLLDFRQKQMGSEGQTSDLQNELKVKSFEYQKLQVLLEETLHNLKQSQASYDKLQKKMDVLMKEYYGMQVTFEKRNTELEAVVKFKESQPPHHNSELLSIKNKMIELETERNTLVLEKKQMSADLQKLLSQNQELAQLKRMIESNTTKPKTPSRITFQKPFIS